VSGRRGTAMAFDSNHANVGKLNRSRGNVGGESRLDKLFIANFTVVSMPVFSSVVHACLLHC